MHAEPRNILGKEGKMLKIPRNSLKKKKGKEIQKGEERKIRALALPTCQAQLSCFTSCAIELSAIVLARRRRTTIQSFRRRPPGLIQHVLTVPGFLVGWCWYSGSQLHPGASDCAHELAFALRPLRHKNRIAKSYFACSPENFCGFFLRICVGILH